MLSDFLKKQLAAEDHLPKYNYHVTPSIVSLEDGRVMFTVRAKGVPFEVISDNVLDNHYDALNNVFLSIAKSTGSRLAVWAHLDHYQTKFSHNKKFGYEWIKDFDKRYMQKFENIAIFENNFYLSFVLKPTEFDALEDVTKELEEIQSSILQNLRMYEAELLTKYEHNGFEFSQVYEFMAYLYNGFWERVPVTSLPLYQAISTSYLHHDYSFIETRFPHGSKRYSSFLDLQDFPEPTKRGLLNPILELQFPFVMCLSLSLISVSDSINQINQALNKMVSAGDEAHQQMDDMAEGKGALMSGEIYFGEFHSTMMIHGSTEKITQDRVSNARTTLSASCASRYVQGNASAPESFYSMFPANGKKRPRPMPKTTRSFLGMFSMNTYSSGKQYGNPIGDGSALLPLKTTVHGVYHLNTHYSLPDVDVLGDKIAGHTAIHGATGVGKTTLQTTILTYLSRFDTKIFGIDKDGSMRGCIESLGGTYFTLASGMPTGLNPFQLPDNPMNRNFLYDLVAACGKREGKPLTAEDIKDIKIAVDNVFTLDFQDRRFSALLQNIPDHEQDSLARRLAEWGIEDGIVGRFAYALDNPTNNFDWETLERVGFDVTDFLVADHPATEPILSYLLHLKTLIKRKGGLMVTVIEEYWLPLKYPTTAAQIEESLKVGRRRDEFVFLVSQSPEDAITSPLLPTILQQTPTKIYLPNPEAEYTTPTGGGYIRFGLTPKEFQKLKSLGTQSRQFLVKQGSQSTIAKLDLEGLGDYISVIAMAADDFPILEAAQKAVGKNPDAWIPQYISMRKASRTKSKVIQSTKEEEIAS